jgi:hypothetical protein
LVISGISFSIVSCSTSQIGNVTPSSINTEIDLPEYLGSRDYRILLVGETHYMERKNRDVLLNLVRICQKRSDNILLLERGYAEGFILNESIDAPNNIKAYPLLFFEYDSDFLIAYKESVNRFPESDFILVGVDYERQFEFTRTALKLLLVKYDLRESPELMRLINKTITAEYQQRQRSTLELNKFVAKIETDTTTRLDAEALFHLERISAAYREELMQISYKNGADSIMRSRQVQREHLMLSSIRSLDSFYHHKSLIIGSFGLLHISKKGNAQWLEHTNWNSMASMLCNYSDYQEAMITLPLLYKHFSLIRNNFSSYYSRRRSIGLSKPELKGALNSSQKGENTWFEATSQNFDAFCIVR